MARPVRHGTADDAVDAILRDVGPRIVLGLPLGLGKANSVANALFERAAADASISLRIFTALTLEPPRPENELEARFMGPVMERLVAGYPALLYARALRVGALPPNIEVNEFFFLAGRWLSVPHAQQTYISANYTHAAPFLLSKGVNVIAQLVARRTDESGSERFSLSCNTDMTLDLLAARRSGRASFMLVGQVNSELPFMSGDADVPPDEFAHILDSPVDDFTLFAPPKLPVGRREYAIGLHTARLISDGGTLQIGIGEEADATVQALILRHRDNDAFRQAITALRGHVPPLPDEQDGPFSEGLHGVSEMFVDGFLELLRRGILKREVDGAVLSAAFFLGSRAFYCALREMPEAERARLQMKAVSFTNHLYGDEVGKMRARTRARFVNNTMMATLLGAAISDTLEDGRVVSGVGGQYNFVAQAFALPDARSVLALKSTRRSGRRLVSNIRWQYGQETIPRHLRDVFVTEYGIADVRGRTDAETIAAMLAIADSRFQPELLYAAKDAGKIARNYEIPGAHRDNTPERISRAISPFVEAGHLPPYPFGTDFDEIEQRLLEVLNPLKGVSGGELFRLVLCGAFERKVSLQNEAAVRRMGLDRPKSLSQWFYRFLLLGALTR